MLRLLVDSRLLVIKFRGRSKIIHGFSTELWLCLVSQLCLTLYNPINCSSSGSSVQGIFQVRILDWVVMPFSERSSQTRDQTQVFCIAGGFLTIWATKKALTPQLFMGQIYFWTNLLEMTIFRLRPKTRISETLGVGFSNLFKVFRVFLVFSKAWRIISNHFLKKKKKKGRKKEKKRKEGWLWAVTIMAKVTVLIRRNNFTWSIPSM